MELTYINKENLKELLHLSNEGLLSLLATFNIKTESEITINTLKGMVSFLNKINNSNININYKNITFTKSPKVENLEDLIKAKQSNKSKVKINTLDNTKEVEQIVKSPIVEEIVEVSKPKQSNKTRTKKDTKTITKAIKEKPIKNISLVKECTHETQIELTINEPIEEITGVVGKKENLIKTSSKKDVNKIVNISYMKSRYDLYVENCLNDSVTPVSIEIYKNIKDYPIDSSFVFNLNLKCTKDVGDGLRKIFGPKEASKVFNSGFKVYYTNNENNTSILCQLDITKPFATNLKDVTQTTYKKGFHFYTKCEEFDPNLIEKVITNLGRKWSKEEDERILAFYNSKSYANTNKKNNSNDITLKELAKEFKIDTKSIRERALTLGFTNFKKPKDKEWSPEEIKLLENCVGKYNPKKISKVFKENGFTRGSVAISVKLKRLKFSQKLDGSNEINLRMLSDAMGVDGHFFYDNNRLEKLKARKENKIIIFEKKNIATYLKENPYDYSLAKVEPKWFIDILTEGNNTHETI